MEQILIKVKLPQRLIKASGLKQGDRLELVVDEEGNGVVVVLGESAIEQAFSIRADIKEDGVTYVRQFLSR